jgi:hypothetical protein
MTVQVHDSLRETKQGLLQTYFHFHVEVVFLSLKNVVRFLPQ